MKSTCADRSKRIEGFNEQALWLVEATCPYCDYINETTAPNYYGFTMGCVQCDEDFEVVDYED